MKITTCLYQDNKYIAVVDCAWNQIEAGKVLLLNSSNKWPAEYTNILAYIDHSGSSTEIAKTIMDSASGTDWISLQDVTLCAPIPNPIRNIICLGWNYAEHAEESASVKGIKIDNLPEDPIVFTKATTTVNDPFGDINYDDRVSTRLDWEVELGVIIGKQGRHIPQESALDYVFGYTVINDVSARDLQKRHKQFFLGKSVDGTCPMGPWIVTADEIKDPQNLNLNCKVNEVVKQNGNTNQQIFSVANIISTLSKAMTLLPGDIIATGTPSGVGFARNPPEYLKPGDVVECEVELIGKIINTVV